MTVIQKGLLEPQLKRALWQLVADLGGEITLTNGRDIKAAVYWQRGGREDTWPASRKLRCWFNDDGTLDLIADGEPDPPAEDLPPLSEVITNLTPTSSPFMEMLNAAHSSGTGTPATPGSRGDTPRRDGLPGSDAGQGPEQPAERQAAHEGDHPGPD